jgi:hypothetical protein
MRNQQPPPSGNLCPDDIKAHSRAMLPHAPANYATA